MDNGLIPQRYAKALYKYAGEHSETTVVYDEAKVAIHSFQDNPGMQKVLSNPFVKTEDKEKLLYSAAGKPGEAYKRFVRLVTDHRREEFFLRMMLAYRDIYRKENNIRQARIVTATDLGKDYMDKLRTLVGNAFKDSVIEYSEEVNPELIGGFVIDVDSVRMDASVSNELEQLRQTLLSSK